MEQGLARQPAQGGLESSGDEEEAEGEADAEAEGDEPFEEADEVDLDEEVAAHEAEEDLAI